MEPDYSTNPRIERPETIEDALEGLEFPAPRGKVVQQAEDNHAAPRLIEELRRIPEDRDFMTREALDRTLDELGLDPARRYSSR